MRVGFRADSSVSLGTGHVMRCLTLARQLVLEGAEVRFYSYILENSWLRKELAKFNIKIYETSLDFFNSEYFVRQKLDLLVVDSYSIPSQEINSYSEFNPTMAIIDGDSQGIFASIYLDQNLNADLSSTALANSGSLKLFGSRYSLVRKEVIDLRWDEVKTPSSMIESSIICFSGGSDPKNVVTNMARLVAKIPNLKATFIAPQRQHSQIKKCFEPHRQINVIEFTSNLPGLLSQSTAAISAVGTSAWELATMGIPAAYTVVAENQINSILAVEKENIGLNFGLSDDLLTNHEDKQQKLKLLLLDTQLRNQIFDSCRRTFDGLGAKRVTDAIKNYDFH